MGLTCLGPCSLTDNPIGDEGALAFASSLKCNTSLKSLMCVCWTALCLARRWVPPRRRCLVAQLRDLTHTCSLEHTSIGDNGAVAIAEVLQTSNRSLETLV